MKTTRYRFRLSLKVIVYIALCLIAVIIIYAFSDGAEDRSAASKDFTSLDLRVAAQAKYNSSAIKTVTQLGPDNNINSSVIKFSVVSAGLTEFGLMTTPSKPAPAAGYPVIILLHGYSQPAAYSTKNAYLSDMEFYSQHGFVVVKPDLRGQGLSSKQGRPEGAYYSMAYNTDIQSLISSVKLTPGLDAHNISLWGHSMGAYLALRAAVLSPDIKNVILLAGPVGDDEEMYNSYVPKSDLANPVAYKIRKAALKQYGTPLTNAGFWYNTSPLNFLYNTHAFIQIHVGSKDKVVPPKFSADLDLALNQAKLPHDYYVYPTAGHGLLAERSQIYARSLQVLQK